VAAVDRRRAALVVWYGPVVMAMGMVIRAHRPEFIAIDRSAP
jgi:hypothetical protein